MLLLMARKWVWLAFVLSPYLFLGCLPSLPCDDQVPSTKREYLTCFRSFTQYVSTSCQKFSSWELESIDLRFQQLTGDWYRMFSKQLSARERVKILAYCGKYFECRIDTDDLNWLDQLEELLFRDIPEPSFKEFLITSPQKN